MSFTSWLGLRRSHRSLAAGAHHHRRRAARFHIETLESRCVLSASLVADTVLVRDIYPGSTGSDPASLVAMNNKLYFAATDPDHGRELWDPPPVAPPSSGSYLYVADYDKHAVLRYDSTTGQFVDAVVPNHAGGLHEPLYPILGPLDGDLYVGSGHFNPSNRAKGVLRFDELTGDPLGMFTETDRLDSVHSLVFGPDGDLFVGDWAGGFQDRLGGRILRFDGATGAWEGEFVTTGSGGIVHPFGMAFAPRPGDPSQFDLYVCNIGDQEHAGNVLRFDGATGEFLGEFVVAHSGGLGLPNSLTFGPDGNLYVSSNNAFDSGGLDAVLRYQGPGGSNPGAFLGVFVGPGSGELESPTGILFGPDGNADGRQDLYVANSRLTGVGADQGRLGTVKRYDGVSGAFVDTFIALGSGRLSSPSGLFFTESNPTTLAYVGSGLDLVQAQAVLDHDAIWQGWFGPTPERGLRVNRSADTTQNSGGPARPKVEASLPCLAEVDRAFLDWDSSAGTR